MEYSYVYLILLLPMLSFVILGLAGMKMSHKVAGLIGTTSLGIVTILSYITAFTYFFGDRAADGAYPTIVPFNFTWLPLGSLNFDLGFMIDPISAMMLIVISTVSLMVHIYSFGYMHGEKGFQRYYARSCSCNQHFPDVYVLGACRRQLVPAHRFLLSVEGSRGSFKEGVYRHSFC